MSKGERLRVEEAKKVADWFTSELNTFVPGLRVEIAGSIRRGKLLVGDIDIVVGYETSQIEGVNEFLLKQFGGLVTNPSRGSRSGEYHGIQLQVMDVPKDRFGAALLTATGSGEFNIVMRREAKSKGWKLNQYGLWLRDKEQDVCDPGTEESIFDALNIEYVDPRKRSF